MIQKFTVKAVFVAITLAATVCLLEPTFAFGQEILTRKVKNRVTPEYPELAKRMNLSGSVKLEVVVASNGSLKTAKVLGGHPVLATAAMDAVKRWRFEPASAESSGTVEFRFAPNGQ